MYEVVDSVVLSVVSAAGSPRTCALFYVSFGSFSVCPFVLFFSLFERFFNFKCLMMSVIASGRGCGQRAGTPSLVVGGIGSVACLANATRMQQINVSVGNLIGLIYGVI